MSYDGIEEEVAIRGRLGTLAGGRILDQTPDDVDIPVDELGKVRPYIVLSVGVPFPKAGGGRAFSDGEKDIPYTHTLVVGCYAGDRNTLNALYRAVMGKLVDWIPLPNDNTALAVVRAVNGSRKANEVRPAILSKIAALSHTINLAPA